MSNAAAQDAADAASRLAAAATASTNATSTAAANTALLSHSTLPTAHMLSSAYGVPANLYQSAGQQWTTSGAASYALPSQSYMTTLAGGQSGAYHYAPLTTSHSYLPSHTDYGQLIYSQHIPHTLSIRPGTAMYATSTGGPGTVIGADGEEVEVDSKGMRVIRVKRACSNCKSAKTKCDNERPCRRCTRTGRVASCVDSIHKKRGRKRTGLPGDNEANSDSDTDGDDDGTKRKSDSLTPNKRSKASRNSTDLTDAQRFASSFGRIISTPTMNVPIQTIPNSSPAEWLTSFVQHLRANNERWMQLIASYGASLTDPATAQRANQWITKFIDYLSSPEVTTAATNTTTSPTDSSTALTAVATNTTTTTTDDKDDKSKLAAAVAAASTGSSSTSVDPNDPVATSMEQSKLVYAQVHIPVLLMSYSPFPFHTSTRPAWANQTFCDILGYTPAEVEQLLKTVHGWSQIYHMVNIPAFVQSFVEAVHRGSASYTVRARFIRKDRTQIELNESASITYQSATNADGTPSSSCSGVPLMISLLFHPVDQTAQFATSASSFSPSGARGPILYPSTFYTADPNSFMNFATTSAASLGSMRPATSPTSAYFTTTNAASAAAAAAAAAAAGGYSTSQLSASPTSSSYARQIYPTRDNTVALINGSMVLSNSGVPTSSSYLSSQPVMMVDSSGTQSAVTDPAAAAAAASYYSTAVNATPTKSTTEATATPST